MPMETVSLIIRHGINALGSVGLFQGIATQDELTGVGGALALLVSTGWSWWRKYSRSKAA